MLKGILRTKSEKLRVFQVLLLHNDASQEVEVQEGDEVDFLTIQDHLKQGGSVFITSKNSQKLTMPKEEKKHFRNAMAMRTLTTFYFDHI